MELNEVGRRIIEIEARLRDLENALRKAAGVATIEEALERWEEMHKVGRAVAVCSDFVPNDVIGEDFCLNCGRHITTHEERK